MISVEWDHHVDPPDRDDEVLAAGVAAGDASALEALYHRYGARCYGLARRLVGDAQLAQDVVQEAFLAVWHHPGHHPGRGSVATWLLTITHHKAVDQVRREARRRTPRVDLDQLHQVPNPGPGPHEQAWTAVRADQVRQTLADLPAEQRQVLLAYYGGYTQTEIAALTGVSLGTVKTRTLAAMRKLGDALPGLSPYAGDNVRRTR